MLQSCLFNPVIQPSPKQEGEPVRLDILSIDIAGNTASARVRDDYLGLTFLDSLSLLKTDGRWSICNKLFHVEGPAGWHSRLGARRTGSIERLSIRLQ